MVKQLIENFYYSFDGSFSFYLLKGEKNILIDAGILDRVNLLNKFIQKTLNPKEKIDIVLLTHSHYDHCGGIPFLKEFFPDIKIMGSERTKAIFSKQQARNFIKEMNESIATEKKYNDYEKLIIDAVLKEGNIIETGKFKIKVLETPGHTKCSLSFYEENNKIFFAGDSSGILEKNDKIKPLFFSEYSRYLKSMDKIKSFNMDILALPHNIPFKQQTVSLFIENSYNRAKEIGENIKERLLKGLTEDEIVRGYMLKQFDIKDAMDQPMETFMLNLYSLVRAVKKEV
jgi:glyoxylase-like metal-dependent hydrolase (beta-lactamase superfamily II)